MRQFDDGRVVYLGQVGDAMPYRDGDLLVVLRPKRGGGLADTSGHQFKFTSDALSWDDDGVQRRQTTQPRRHFQ
jgi:hypothetical protein